MKQQIVKILEEDFANRPFVWCSEISDKYNEYHGVRYANTPILDVVMQFPDWEIDKCDCTNPMIYRIMMGTTRTAKER